MAESGPHQRSTEICVVPWIARRRRAFIVSSWLAWIPLVGMIWGSVAWSAETVDLEAFRPKWTVGQEWVVETIVRQSAAARELRPGRTPHPVSWKFVVEAEENCDSRPCYRLKITSMAPGRQPETTLWVDKQTMSLRRTRMQIPAAEGFRVLDERYQAASGQPFAAIAPLTVPGVAFPLFQEGAKGPTSYQYQALSGTGAGAKGLGDIGFGISVQQKVMTPPSERSSLLPADYSKSLSARPMVELRLQSAQEQVRQVWQEGLPWPLMTDNGHVESRLVPPSPPSQPSTTSK